MLFCLTADYTPQRLNAMREDPDSYRQAAVERLLSAAGASSLRCTQGYEGSRYDGDFPRY